MLGEVQQGANIAERAFALHYEITDLGPLVLALVYTITDNGGGAGRSHCRDSTATGL